MIISVVLHYVQRTHSRFTFCKPVAQRFSLGFWDAIRQLGFQGRELYLVTTMFRLLQYGHAPDLTVVPSPKLV